MGDSYVKEGKEIDTSAYIFFEGLSFPPVNLSKIKPDLRP